MSAITEKINKRKERRLDVFGRIDKKYASIYR